MVKKSSIYHFPVGNGDMTLLKIASNNRYYYVLVDMHIRQSSMVDEDKCDVLSELHNLLEKDSQGRPYIDALVLTHPDEDHIRGYNKYFHQGSPDSYTTPKQGEKGRVFVNEIWSSPIIFRRKQKRHGLCDDAKAFNTEAKRRVELYRKSKNIGLEGDRIRLIGEDSDGKTDDILSIVYRPGDSIVTINEARLQEIAVDVLAPLPDDDFKDSESLDKNCSSIVMRWGIASHGYTVPTSFILLAGDASVEAWEVISDKYPASNLEYDLLLAPHHCSWHTLSHDSYSDSDNPMVSEKAKEALNHARTGAVILSSSDPIKDDDNDPPNYGAKQVYSGIAKAVSGSFSCLADNIPKGAKAPTVRQYRLTSEGPQIVSEAVKDTSKSSSNRRTAATTALFGHTGQAIGHG